MKKIFRILSVLALCVPGISFTASQAQVNTLYNTPQAPNFDFEVWDNPEPWGWNSSSSFEAAGSPSRNQSVWSSEDIRPGSNGKYSVRIKVTESKFGFGICKVMMGSLTTGVMYYLASATNNSSCIYTNTGDGSKRWAFTGRPDSIVFWAKSGANGGRNSDMTLYLHNNAKLEDRNPNGTAKGTVIGSANLKMPAGGQWVRYSAPIRYESDETPAYLLLSFTAGNNFREVVEGDELFIDDVLLVYNPVLSIDTTSPLQMAHHGSQDITFDLPYTFYSGTQDPLNASAQNELRVYLSDENGSFDNKQLLATQQVNGGDNNRHQGRIRVTLPANTPDSDKYRLRIEASNYSLQSNIINLNIYSQWYLTIRQADRYGTTNALDKTLLRNGISYTATATPNTACAFLHWIENGTVIDAPAEYGFIIDRDRELVAEFDTTYTLIMAESVGADGYFANNNAKELTLVHGQIASVRADIQTGYFFRGFDFVGDIWRPQTPAYEYMVQRGGTIRVLTDSISYEFEFSAWPEVKLGSVTGSGTYKHFSTVRAQAQAANEYSHFLYWIDEEENVVGNEPVLELANISRGGKYRAVFEETFHTVSLSVNDPKKGYVLQCAQPKADSTYSAFDLTHIYLRAVPQRGIGFRRWEVTKDNMQQADILENPYDLTNNTHLDADYTFRAIFDTLEYYLTLSAMYGSAEGEGTYMYGKSVWLRAEPDEGCHFVQWESGSSVLGTEDSLYVTIYGDTSIKAVCAPNEYELTIVSNDESLGKVDKASGIYTHFTQLELNALPEPGAELRYWVIDNDTLSTANRYVLDVRRNHHVLAIFSHERSHVNLTVNNSAYGQVSGAGIYEWHTPVRIEARAFEGYRFIGWKTLHEDTLKKPLITIDAIEGDTSLQAVFAPQVLNLELQADGNGRVFAGEPADALAQRQVDYMSYWQIYAEPDAGYEFEGWYDRNGNLLSTYVQEGFSVGHDTLLIGRFVPLRYAVNLFMSPLGACSLQGTGRYDAGSEVSISETTLGSYDLLGWYEADTLYSDQPEFKLSNLSANRYFTARFREKRIPARFKAEPAAYADTCLGMGDYKYAYNANFEVVPQTGYEVFAWVNQEGDTLSRLNPYLHEIRNSDSLTALMRPALLHPVFGIEPEDAGRVRCPDLFYGIQTVATAQPAYGYAFSHWKDARGNRIGNAAALAFTAKTDTTFTAVFEPRVFTIKAKPRRADRGEVSGDGNYRYLDECTLAVECDPHYQFVGWCDQEGKVLSYQYDWTFTVTEDLDVTAYFEPLPVRTHLAVEPENGGTIRYEGGQMLGEVNVFFEKEITLTAEPAQGMVFKRWLREDTSGTVDEWMDASHTFVPQGGRIVTAVFDTAEYALSVAVEPAQAGRVSGEGTYKYMAFAPLQAEAAEHYDFYAYTVNDRVLSYDSAYALRMDSAMEVTAVFKPKEYMLWVYASDKTKGQAVGTGRYPYGSRAQVEAFAWNDSLAFAFWSRFADGHEVLSAEALMQYEVKGSDTLYAFFEPSRWPLRLKVEGGGSVSGEGLYVHGSKAQINAVAHRGYHFVAWQEYGMPVDGYPQSTLLMNGGRILTAVFAPDTFHLELGNAGEDPAPLLFGTGDYVNGSSIDVWISDKPAGYRFVAWKNAGGQTVSESPDFVFTVVSDTALYAEWEPLSYAMLVKTEGEGQAAGAGRYAYGEKAVMRAVPGEGQRFVAWYRNHRLFSQKDSIALPLFSDMELTARFEKDTVAVEPVVNTKEGGRIEISVLSDASEEVRLLAVPEKDYRFVYWSMGDSLVSTELQLQTTRGNASGIVAHFEPELYRVQLRTHTPEGLSDLSGSGSFNSGDMAKLKATLRKGYVFEGWFEEGSSTPLSLELEYSLKVERNMKIMAVVRKQ